MFGKRHEILVDSFRSKADLRAVLKYLDLPDSDMLVFGLEESKLFRPNFFVSIDRSLSAIVLSIRGTMVASFEFF